MKAGAGFALTQIKKLGQFDYVPDGFEYSEYLDLYVTQYGTAPRKPAGAQVASLRCPILHLLAPRAYYTSRRFSMGSNSIVLDRGSTLAFHVDIPIHHISLAIFFTV